MFKSLFFYYFPVLNRFEFSLILWLENLANYNKNDSYFYDFDSGKTYT
jgi:hypothetical protein